MFEPLNDHHAIQEVTFVISFERAFTAAHLTELEAAHTGAFKKELPKKERSEVFQVAFGNSPPPITPMLSPLSFIAYKRDGEIDWRLHCEQNDLIVNCLTYTRWNEVSARALNLLEIAAKIFMRGGKLGIKSISLQFLDTFKWRGKTTDYDVRLLLRDDSPSVPKSIFDHGSSPLWHLHQGWFSGIEYPLAGRTLQRNHLDATQEGGSYVVRMDTLLRHDLESPSRRFDEMFQGSEGPVASVLSELHQLDKRIIRSYITDEIAQRINLDVPRVADR